MDVYQIKVKTKKEKCVKMQQKYMEKCVKSALKHMEKCDKIYLGGNNHGRKTIKKKNR